MRRAARETLPQGSAADLLDVVALDREGVLVRRDGALVRYVELIPINPEVLGGEAREGVVEGLTAALARIDPGESLQIYVEAAPVQLERLLAERRERVARALERERPGRAAALERLADAYDRTLIDHAEVHAAIRLSIYLIVPYRPTRPMARPSWQTLRPGAGRQAGALRRSLDEHRRLRRRSERLCDELRGDFEALGFATVQLDGPEVMRLLYRRLNPSSADRGHIPCMEVVGELDAATDLADAVRMARELRDTLAASPVDFSDSRFVRIEEDLEQILYVSAPPQHTPLGWLLEPMKAIDRPFVLSVHVHARDRGADQRRAQRRLRRLYGLNAGARARSEAPNPDREAQEHEAWALHEELRARRQAGLVQISTVMAVREPGPLAEPARLAETAQTAATAIRTASQANAKLGGFLQQPLLQATFPLGIDTARRAANLDRQYANRHAAASLPVFGTGCGSPLTDGALPFFTAKELGTLEGINPWDRLFINRLMVANGLQGSGKTMFGITLAARLLPYGVQLTVLDRSDHWEMLTRLVPGAAHLSLGPGSEHATINPWDVPDPSMVDGETIGGLVDLHEVLIGDRHADSDSYALSPLERNLLEMAIRGTYQRGAREQRPVMERDLQAELEHMRDDERAKAGAETEVSATYNSLARRLDQYVRDGRDAYLVDRPTSVPADAPLVVFDTRRAGKQIVAAMFIALRWTLARVERRRAERLNVGDPLATFRGDAFFSDEAWQYFQRRATGEFFHDLVRRSRHLGLFLLAITQHLDDFNNSQGRPLLRSATMKVFFQQATEELRYLTDTLGLSDNEVRLISRLGTAPGRFSRAYLINGPRGRGEVTLRLGELEYWLATSNDRDQERRNAALARHPGDPWAALHELAKEGRRL